MQTKLTYENNSLNPHTARLGLFWDVASPDCALQPLLWGAIEKCRFGWHHSLSIDWKPTFLLRDSWGNWRPLTLGIDQFDTGTRVEHRTGFGMNWQVQLSQKAPRPDLTFVICRNKRPLAQIPLGIAGTWRLTMPDRLLIEIACPVKLSDKILDRDATAFSLNGVSSLKISLLGGTPGHRSTPLKLVPYDVVST